MMDDSPPTPSNQQQSNNVVRTTRNVMGQWANTAGQAVQQWTARKYTLPDKNVASQVLMYRQLLHTSCRPGLKLSRPYQGTAAQKAVKHMPWWAKGIDETQKMEIAYDNLIQRLWLHGALLSTTTTTPTSTTTTTQPASPQDLLDADKHMPPIPHDYWVDRLGFQQTDPVTDFRSGGVLSLAMMVWITESCPAVHARFLRPDGDASVLPFAITAINITDMMARFLMLTKAVDRMDALLSQKPFWRMFADPNALLACQELAMDLLAQVVVEVRAIRVHERSLLLKKKENTTTTTTADPNNNGDDDNQADRDHNDIITQEEEKDPVTVFDFAQILAITEKRVELDLLGAGPGSVTELRAIHQRLTARYEQQLQIKLQRMSREANNERGGGDSNHHKNNIEPPPLQVLQGVGVAATSFAGSVMQKIKSPGFNPLRQQQQQQQRAESDNHHKNNNDTTEAIVFENAAPTTTTTTTTPPPSQPAKTNNTTKPAETVEDSDGEWAGTDIPGATEQIGNFSIGGDDDDDEDI